MVDKTGEVKVQSLGKGVESGGHHKLVLPEKWRNEVFHELHSVRTAGHLGIAKTLRKVGDRFYWAGYAEDIKKLVQNCPQCVHKQKPRGRAPMKLYHSGAPMERIAMDILGPLPETYRGNKYVLCIGDYFTKWIEAIPLPDQEARTIAEALIESVICRFGVPLQIHTDQGRNFQSALLLELCQLLDIDKTRTTPYRPQSDGMVERFNRTLTGMLTSFVSSNQKDWDEHIPFIIMAYRSAVHSSTGFTPNMMMMGREIKLPLDLIYGKARESPNESPNEYVEEITETLERVHEMARSKLKIASEQQKRNYDLKGGKGLTSFSEGQLVWYYCPLKQKGLSPKLQMKWHGPCKVKKQISDLLYEIETTTTLHKTPKRVVVHCDKLKPYVSQEHNSEPRGNSSSKNLVNSPSDNAPDTKTQEPTTYLSRTGRTSKKPQWYGIP